VLLLLNEGNVVGKKKHHSILLVKFRKYTSHVGDVGGHALDQVGGENLVDVQHLPLLGLLSVGDLLRRHCI
jgi:hypothetical protein